MTGEGLNSVSRIANGSNNYKESAIRQFLNSSSDIGSVWNPQTKFDRPPAWVNNTEGFKKGLDAELLTVVGKVVVPCGANSVYESPDSTTKKGEKYSVADEFYLVSKAEIFGTEEQTSLDDSSQFPYYKSATNTDRIKYVENSARPWWCRTVVNTGAYAIHLCTNGGILGDLRASVSSCVVPCFTIV